MPLILGIESSCDETAASVVEDATIIPKSDINPALEAGLRAVFIPHPRTWILERAEIREVPGRLIRIDRFDALREHF